jgi:hypothetical protein
VTDIRVGDVDGDGRTEFVFVKEWKGVYVYVYDGTSYSEEWFAPIAQAVSLDLADIDGDSDLDILVGDHRGTVTAFDGPTKTQLFSDSIGDGEIYSIRAADIDGDSKTEIVLSQDNIWDWNTLKMLRASDRALLWESPPLSWKAGTASSLYISDADDDGNLEISVGTARSVRFFEYSSQIPDTEAPFFPGSAGLQSAAPLTCCAAVDLNWEEALDAASPPVEYNIYRDTVSGFTPGSGNFLARTPFSSYRDVSAQDLTEYYYIVRAVDAKGNEDGNLVTLSAAVDASDPVPPDQGNILRAVKASPDVRLEFSGAPAMKWRVFRDYDKTKIGTTALTPDTTQTTFTDSSGILPTGLSFYYLRGLSPCTWTPGP